MRRLILAGLVSTLAAGLGLLAGWSLYRQRTEEDPLRSAVGPLWTVLENRYYIDAFYMTAIVYPVRDRLSAAVYWTNQNILDGVVNGMGILARALARLVSWFDRMVIDGFVNSVGDTAGEAGGLLRYLQSGNMQWYAVGLFVGVIALTIVFITAS